MAEQGTSGDPEPQSSNITQLDGVDLDLDETFSEGLAQEALLPPDEQLEEAVEPIRYSLRSRRPPERYGYERVRPSFVTSILGVPIPHNCPGGPDAKQCLRGVVDPTMASRHLNCPHFSLF